MEGQVYQAGKGRGGFPTLRSAAYLVHHPLVWRQQMVAESVQGESPAAAAEAKTALLQTFGSMGGVSARADDFARALPRCHPEDVAEALDALVEEGSVEVALLSDGAVVYHFIRH
jgi:hypothetical protein